MACTLLRGLCRDLMEERYKEGGKSSDHGHNCVSTYAGIAITIVFPKGTMMILWYCSHVIRASINVWLCYLVYRCG